ncbi:speckle-type POZ protein B-like [Argiope bruennichi]|uniref:speckle-type POZ protein B-like n=1 Tax=Argiope bruennichi TaxID=94029 RepID=UPI0024940863|nr:speckle-type POZ protein B-like [Argiope bruennichi]
MASCSIQSARKVLEIKLVVENISKQPFWESVVSPDFYITPECMCCITVDKGKMYLHVRICNKSDFEIKIERKIVLFDCSNKKLHEESDAKIFSLEKDKNVDVMEGFAVNNCDNLPNDTLIIDLGISIKETTTVKLNRFACDTNPERRLKEDFKTMLENPVNSDVCLQVGDDRIAAHWSVLCSRSPYFKEMFDSGIKEQPQNSITITDIYAGTVKKLVEFLYTATFAQNCDFHELFDLYYAADKYEVMDLRNLCACRIISEVTTENVCQILLLAHRHSDKSLKKEAMDFIQAHADAVFQTEGWRNLEASEPVIADLISYFCVKKN